MRYLIIIPLLFGCAGMHQTVEDTGIRYMLYQMQDDITYNYNLTAEQVLAKSLTYILFSIPLAVLDYNAPILQNCKQQWNTAGVLITKCYNTKQVDFCSQQFPNNQFERDNCKVILGN